jgi:hypothetical protein
VRTKSTIATAALFLLASLAVGCGGGTGNRLSGKITFNGQPVPAGKIYIVPDTSKGNKGEAGYADIVNGTYDTSAEGGKGGVTGAVIIKIEGIDPKPPPGAEPDVTSTVLFSGYEEKADLPAAASEKNIDVPAEAAKGPTAPAAGSTVIP